MSELTLRELAAIGVERLKGVGDKKLAGLREMGIETVLDLVTCYPRRWVDRTQECRVSDMRPGVEALVLVTVRTVDKRIGRNRRPIVEAVVGDGSGRCHVVFFNQPWRERQLRPDLQIALWGKPELYRGALQLTNPVVDLIGDRTGRIVPIYPQSEKSGLNTWEIAGWVEDALRKCAAARYRRPGAARGGGAARPVAPCSRTARHPPARRPSPTRSGPVAAWPSTSCCACRRCW